jgi:hypothetical protein
MHGYDDDMNLLSKYIFNVIYFYKVSARCPEADKSTVAKQIIPEIADN